MGSCVFSGLFLFLHKIIQTPILLQEQKPRLKYFNPFSLFTAGQILI